MMNKQPESEPRRTACWHCSSTEIVRLSSTDEVICNRCKKTSPWRLKPGQPSVLVEGKVGGVA